MKFIIKLIATVLFLITTSYLSVKADYIYQVDHYPFPKAKSFYKGWDVSQFELYTPNYSGSVKSRVALFSDRRTKYTNLKVIMNTYGSSLKASQTETVTLGSTRQHVINVLGSPKDEYRSWGTLYMIYDKGVIFLVAGVDHGYVVGWINDGLPNIELGKRDSKAPTFKLGSSIVDVVKSMGTPKYIPPYYISESMDYFIYEDGSTVFFDKFGKVMSYINTKGLKVSLGAKVPGAPPINAKSKVADVIKAMGTPDSVNAFFIETPDYLRLRNTTYTNQGYSIINYDGSYTYYRYGDSFIAFDKNEKIIHFLNKGNLNINYGKKDPKFLGIKVNSTEVDIIKAMGTPDKILDNEDYWKNWYYGGSYVKVDEKGKIVGWVNKGNLKISKADRIPTAPIIGIGSSKQSVINAMGSPDQYGDTIWAYGESQITFHPSGKVTKIYKPGGVKFSNSKKALLSKGFTFGSSTSDVVKAMGAPDRILDGSQYGEMISWSYGINDLYNNRGQVDIFFSNDGKVVYWNSQNNISYKLKLARPSYYSPFAHPITFGATKSNVLRTLGSPTSLTDPTWEGHIWYYGKAFIAFDRDERVTSFELNGEDLKVSYGTKIPDSTFTLGSTKQDVVKAMGIPKDIQFGSVYTTEYWHYEDSFVIFDPYKSLVCGWINPQNLKLTPIQLDLPIDTFTIGSPQQDVLKVMGFPEKIYVENGSSHLSPALTRWIYGSSNVYFNEERKVIRWYNEGNLKARQDSQ